VSTTPKIMLLIDADNLSADVIAQALAAVLADHGAAHVRRAYCTADTALQNQALFRKLLIRPVVNLSAGKNANDIALAVDAIDLVLSERPDVVVIASSDSDFAPLVMRLREKGCRVCGIGQQGKTGDDAPLAYDQFSVLTHGRRSSAARKPVAAVEPPAPRPRRRAAAPVAEPSPVLDEVRRILQAVPELIGGDAVALNLATEKLRGASVLAKSAPSTRLFRKLAQHFELVPERQPNRVRYRDA
jgi:uncharacterized LabA/DUF88 family protein